MTVGRFFSRAALFFLVLGFLVLTISPREAEAQGVCDGPLRVNVDKKADGSGLEVRFSNVREQVDGGFRACFTHYNLRYAMVGHGEQQIEISPDVCPPVPSGLCVTSLGANLDKPYRVVVQGCKTRFLASSRCTPWSEPAFFLPYGPDTCKDGFVWREAFAGDHVCVTPQTRAQAAADNREAASRIQPGAGDTCRVGFVWREADRRGDRPGRDHVCVKPEVRQQSWDDNAQAQARKARP